jgi:sugar (pentulose or hexulose) kinase
MNLIMDVIAIFDIGKTNKKFLLFNSELNIVHCEKKLFPEIRDDDGFTCDDIDAIASWMKSRQKEVIRSGEHHIRALNFTTYGASLMHIDEHGNRVTPLYNYLKPMPEAALDGFYEAWGGAEEFCRTTASPKLGMMNSGLQLLWLKKMKPGLYSQIKTTLHFPQYLSWLFTTRKVSDFTSLGSHTAMWDFDHMRYHRWLEHEGISLPQPVSGSEVHEVIIENQKINTGVGLHDSSSSLVPYLRSTDKPFILVSTGTWCIFMNPFNTEPLTAEQLRHDSLCNLTADGRRVKSSRLFLGHIHNLNAERLNDHFGVTGELFKTIKIKSKKISRLLSSRKGRVFFSHGIPPGYVDTDVNLSHFLTYADAYHQMMCDLVDICMESYRLIIPAVDTTEIIYVTGGFAKNDTFVRILAARVPDKRVFVSDVEDSTALGAAIAVYENTFGKTLPSFYLGLKAIINNDQTP